MDEAVPTELSDRPPSHESPTARSAVPSQVTERLRAGEAVAGVQLQHLRLHGSFPDRVRLTDATIGQLVVDHAEFQAEALIRRCRIRDVKVGASTLAAGLDLQRTMIGAMALRRSTVGRLLSFESLKAERAVTLVDVTVDGHWRCWGAEFGDWLKVQGCSISNTADLRSVHIAGGFTMEGCTLHGPFIFRGSSVELKADMRGTTFHELVDLSKAKLRDFAYFDGATFGPSARLALRNVVTDQLLLRPAQVADRLASEQTGDFTTAAQEYGLLRRNYESLHRYDDEDWALVRYKVNQRRARARTWRRPWSKLLQFGDWLILEVGCGYGTDPLRTARSALVIVAAFGLLYALGSDSLGVATPALEGLDGTPLHDLAVGLLTSVSVFTTGFGGDLLGAGTGGILAGMIIEAMLGVFVWGLFIVAFARKVIR